MQIYLKLMFGKKLVCNQDNVLARHFSQQGYGII